MIPNPNEFPGKKYWFYLHPYTFVSVKSDEALLYNTLSGQYIINRDETIREYLLKFTDTENHYVTRLDGNHVDQRLIDFLQQVRETFMGDFYELADDKKKPVQFFPFPVLELKTEDELSSLGIEPILLEDSCENYLSVLTLQITAACAQNCPMCPGAFKQFTCCRSNSLTQHLSIELFMKLLKELEENFRLHMMNIVGGDLFKHPDFSRMVDRLNHTTFEKHYFFHYKNLAPGDCLRDFPLLGRDKNIMNILVDFPVEPDRFDHVFKILAQRSNTPLFHFVVRDDHELSQLETILNDFAIDDFRIKPYYSGGNLSFFQDNVFIERGFIDEKVVKMQQINANRSVNPLKIKKLDIDCSGKIFSDMNHECLGNVKDFKLIEIVGFAFNRENSSWRQTRSNFKRCGDCVFQYFCPPVSDYEVLMDLPSLCWKSINKE